MDLVYIFGSGSTALCHRICAEYGYHYLIPEPNQSLADTIAASENQLIITDCFSPSTELEPPRIVFMLDQNHIFIADYFAARGCPVQIIEDPSNFDFIKQFFIKPIFTLADMLSAFQHKHLESKPAVASLAISEQDFTTLSEYFPLACTKHQWIGHDHSRLVSTLQSNTTTWHLEFNNLTFNLGQESAWNWECIKGKRTQQVVDELSIYNLPLQQHHYMFFDLDTNTLANYQTPIKVGVYQENADYFFYLEGESTLDSEDAHATTLTQILREINLTNI